MLKLHGLNLQWAVLPPWLVNSIDTIGNKISVSPMKCKRGWHLANAEILHGCCKLYCFWLQQELPKLAARRIRFCRNCHNRQLGRITATSGNIIAFSFMPKSSIRQQTATFCNWHLARVAATGYKQIAFGFCWNCQLRLPTDKETPLTLVQAADSTAFGMLQVYLWHTKFAKRGYQPCHKQEKYSLRRNP